MHLSKRFPVLAGVLLLVVAVASMLLPSVASAATRMPAVTYSCRTSHCYGAAFYAAWQHSMTEYYGGDETVQVVDLTSGTNTPSTDEAFVDEEMWLQESQGTQNSLGYKCYTDNSLTTQANCWVETGYWSYHGHSNQEWFWDASRPEDTSCHPNCPLQTGASIPVATQSSSDQGHTATIAVDYSGTANTWNTYAYSNYTTDTYDNQSTNNLMSPDEVIFGSELEGTGGANAPKVHFTNNEYEDTSSVWHYFTTDGDYNMTTGPYPLAGWVSGHDPLNSTTGGDWETCTFSTCTL